MDVCTIRGTRGILLLALVDVIVDNTADDDEFKNHGDGRVRRC